MNHIFTYIYIYLYIDIIYLYLFILYILIYLSINLSIYLSIYLSIKVEPIQKIGKSSEIRILAFSPVGIRDVWVSIDQGTYSYFMINHRYR